jgi:alpha-NAC-related protein
MMFPNLNPKKMQSIMKQFGIDQEEIPSVRVIIEKENGNKIIIQNPSVTKIKVKGEESFQITGNIEESKKENFSEEDIKIVMQKTNCSRKEAEKTLEETGDLTEAILKLS